MKGFSNHKRSRSSLTSTPSTNFSLFSILHNLTSTVNDHLTLTRHIIDEAVRSAEGLRVEHRDRGILARYNAEGQTGRIPRQDKKHDACARPWGSATMPASWSTGQCRPPGIGYKTLLVDSSKYPVRLITCTTETIISPSSQSSVHTHVFVTRWFSGG